MELYQSLGWSLSSSSSWSPPSSLPSSSLLYHHRHHLRHHLYCHHNRIVVVVITFWDRFSHPLIHGVRMSCTRQDFLKVVPYSGRPLERSPEFPDVSHSLDQHSTHPSKHRTPPPPTHSLTHSLTPRRRVCVFCRVVPENSEIESSLDYGLVKNDLISLSDRKKSFVLQALRWVSIVTSVLLYLKTTTTGTQTMTSSLGKEYSLDFHVCSSLLKPGIDPFSFPPPPPPVENLWGWKLSRTATSEQRNKTIISET